MQVHEFLDTLWLVLKRYLMAKTYAVADTLIGMTAEILSYPPLRMITDQLSTDPVAIVTMALPNVVTERSSESQHLFRTSYAFWKIMRMLLFNASPEPPGRYERLMLRPALIPDSELEVEDAFLAVQYADNRAKPISVLAQVMQKNDILLKTADMIVSAANKNYVRHFSMQLGGEFGYHILSTPKVNLRFAAIRPVVTTCLPLLVFVPLLRSHNF